MEEKKKKTTSTEMHERLIASSNDEYRENRVPRGCIPVLVGSDGSMERFVVQVKVLREPCIMELLNMAAQEFGYGQQGILRIPCDAEHFRQMIHRISHSR